MHKTGEMQLRGRWRDYLAVFLLFLFFFGLGTPWFVDSLEFGGWIGKLDVEYGDGMGG